MFCQSGCMVEFKEGEEQKIKIAARWAEVEGDESDLDDEEEQGRNFARSVIGFTESSKLFLQQNNDEVNTSNMLSVVSHNMTNYEMAPNQRYLLRNAIGPQILCVKGRHYIRSIDKPARSGNREKKIS